MLCHFVCAEVRILPRLELCVRQSKISALSRAAEFASTYLGRNRSLFVEARASGDFLSVAFLILWFSLRVQRLLCSVDRYRFLLDYPYVPKTHPWAIPGTKVDYAIDESVRGACDISLSFQPF